MQHSKPFVRDNKRAKIPTEVNGFKVVASVAVESDDIYPVVVIVCDREDRYPRDRYALWSIQYHANDPDQFYPMAYWGYYTDNFKLILEMMVGRAGSLYNRLEN